MIDLNSRTALGDRITHYIDRALIERNAAEAPRRYLGGSQIGGECERALQYSFFATPADEGKGFSGRILRIFERGHWAEAAVIRWLRLAGFEIMTEMVNGAQFGFEAGVGGLFRGHADGILINGPEEFGPWPRLWESKCLGAKYWRALAKSKLQRERPTYYAQVQAYQRHLGLTEHPAWFVAVNADTMDLHWEAVPFDQAEADRLDTKSARVIDASLHGELLPRAYADPTYYKCKWCDWQSRCWSQGDGVRR